MGVSRSKLSGHFRVVAASLVCVFNQKSNGSPRCDTFINARKDLDGISFLALRHKFALSRAATIQIGLNVSFTQRHPGRATVNHATDSRPVTFAKVCHNKKLSDTGS